METTLDALDDSYISCWRGQSDNPDVNDQEKREALDYSTEALDMSIKRKVHHVTDTEYLCESFTMIYARIRRHRDDEALLKITVNM